jgi:hypothetical protein
VSSFHPRDIGEWDWDRGLGTQLREDLEAGEGIVVWWECPAVGGLGCSVGGGGVVLAAARRLPARGVMRGNSEPGGGGRRRGRGPGCLALVGQRDET